MVWNGTEQTKRTICSVVTVRLIETAGTESRDFRHIEAFVVAYAFSLKRHFRGFTDLVVAISLHVAGICQCYHRSTN